MDPVLLDLPKGSWFHRPGVWGFKTPFSNQLYTYALHILYNSRFPMMGLEKGVLNPLEPPPNFCLSAIPRSLSVEVPLAKEPRHKIVTGLRIPAGPQSSRKILTLRGDVAPISHRRMSP